MALAWFALGSQGLETVEATKTKLDAAAAESAQLKLAVASSTSTVYYAMAVFACVLAVLIATGKLTLNF